MICRWQRRPVERRPEILEAARQLFAEQGFARATLVGVARKAGVSPATVSHYFGSKAALFEALITEQIVDLANDDLTLLIAEGGYRRALHRLVEIEWLRLNTPGTAGLMLVVLGEMDEFPHVAKQLFRQLSERVRLRMADLIRDGVAAGEFDVVNPAITSQLIGSLLFGATIDLQYVSECVAPSPCQHHALAVLHETVDRLVAPYSPITISGAKAQDSNAAR